MPDARLEELGEVPLARELAVQHVAQDEPEEARDDQVGEDLRSRTRDPRRVENDARLARGSEMTPARGSDDGRTSRHVAACDR